jgi:hypothetical protein
VMADGDRSTRPSSSSARDAEKRADEIKAWAAALSLHPNLQHDIIECNRGWKGNSELQYLVYAVEWLRARYAHIWKNGPEMPPDVLDEALHLAIRHGTWDAAAQRLIALFAGHIAPIRGTVFGDGREICPPWGPPPPIDMVSDLAHLPDEEIPYHVAIVLHVFDKATTKADACAALERLWDELVAPRLDPIPGKRGVGQPVNIMRDVRLYRLWHENPTTYKKRSDLGQGRSVITWDDFAALAIGSHHFPKWDEDTEVGSVRDAAEAAIKRLAPDPNVPRTLDAFITDRTTAS